MVLSRSMAGLKLQQEPSSCRRWANRYRWARVEVRSSDMRLLQKIYVRDNIKVKLKNSFTRLVVLLSLYRIGNCA